MVESNELEANESNSPLSETEAAKEVLKETGDEQPDPKTAKIVSQKKQLREEKIENAKLRAAILQKESPEERELSPIEQEAKDQGKPIEEVVVDGKLLQRQTQYEAEKSAKATQKQQMTDFHHNVEKAHIEMDDDAMGEGLGLESLELLGERYITTEDKKAIFNAGTNVGKVAYDLLVKRVSESGGAAAQELQRRLKAAGKTQDKEKDNSEPEPQPIPETEPMSMTDAQVDKIFGDYM